MREDVETYDDRIGWLEEQSIILGKDMARFDIVVLDSERLPLSEIVITGVTDKNGNTIMTNEAGKAVGYSTNRSARISIEDYADLTPIRKTISNTAGQKYSVELLTSRRNYCNFTATTSVRFSKSVSRVDYSVCGGGGSGSPTPWTSKNNYYGGGGGGGGGYCVTGTIDNVAKNTLYPVTIGSGGSNADWDTHPVTTYDYPSGKAGGASSFNGTTASGGNGGGDTSNNKASESGGSGNGNGGAGCGTRSGIGNNGYSGSGTWFNAYASSTGAGGGGGGGSLMNSGQDDPGRSRGGSPNGGGGATIHGGVYLVGSKYYQALDGVWPGGGGGGAADSIYISYSDLPRTPAPGKGANGGVAVRMYFYDE